MNVPVSVDHYAPNREYPKELQTLQQMWEETSSHQKSQSVELGAQETLHLWEAENPTEEVRQLAVEIRRLVSQEAFGIEISKC